MIGSRCSLCGTNHPGLAYLALGQTALCGLCLETLPARLAAAEERLQQAAAQNGESLELATVAELIGELLRRTTFRGLVAWQEESFKGQCWDSWQWRASNCDPAEVATQLASAIRPENP